MKKKIILIGILLLMSIYTVILNNNYNVKTISKNITFVDNSLQSISLNESKVSIDVYETFKLEVTKEPSTSDIDISWTSSNEDVAIVDKYGNVIAVKAGTATIKATDISGKISECLVTVNEKPANDNRNNRIKILAPAYFLNEAEGLKYLQAIIYPKLNDSESVTWSSSDPTKAEIDSTYGIIDIKSNDNGKVIFTATSTENPEDKASIVLEIKNNAFRISDGLSLKEYEVNRSGYRKEDISKIEVGNTSLVTAVIFDAKTRASFGVTAREKAGTTFVYVYNEASELIDSFDVLAYPINSRIKFIDEDRPDINLNKGDNYNISDKYELITEIQNEIVYYSSEDDTVATVDKNGNIVATGGGTTKIRILPQYFAFAIKGSSLSNYYFTVNVSVPTSEIKADDIQLDDEHKTYTIETVILPSDSSNKNVTYKSNDESIVKVDNNGLVTANGNGTTTITIASEDGYTTKDINVTVSGYKRDISSVTFENIASYYYSNKEFTPEVKGTFNGVTLIKNTDFTVEYKDNKNVGTAKIIVTGINDYKGTKELTFTISPIYLNYSGLDQEYSYDGEGHGIKINVTNPKEGYTIKYKDINGEYSLDEMPLYTEIGKHKIEYQISAKNYETVTDFNYVTITKKKDTSVSDIVKKYAEDNNVSIDYFYVVGKYIFTSNTKLELEDLMLGARTINGTKDTDMTVYLYNAKYDDDWNFEGYEYIENFTGEGNAPTEVNIKYIDYNNIDDSISMSNSEETNENSYTLEELNEKILDLGEIDYFFLVGDYIFTSKTKLRIEDLMLAAKTIKVTSNSGYTKKDKVYGEMTTYLYNAKYDDDWNLTGYEYIKNFTGTSKELNTLTTKYIDYNLIKEG